MESLLKFVGTTLIVGLAMLLGAFTLSTLWVWFLVPLGVPALLNGWHALGISMVSTTLVATRISTNEKPLAELAVLGAIKLLVTLGIAWVIHYFMVMPWA